MKAGGAIKFSGYLPEYGTCIVNETGNVRS
jgi:hypothetical protein